LGETIMPTPFALNLAKLAETEFNTYNPLHETHPKMAARIKKYWHDLGLPFPGVGTAWSAVFISAHVKWAGATPAEFKFSPRHSEFVFEAIKDFSSSTGVFHGRDVVNYAPKVGDIIQNNRGGNTYDYAYAKAHNGYKSHSAIVVEEGVDGFGRYVRTVGGNESNTVDDKIVRLKPSGLIKQPAADPTRYISIIQTLK
jgi:hypothetical protein